MHSSRRDGGQQKEWKHEGSVEESRHAHQRRSAGVCPHLSFSPSRADVHTPLVRQRSGRGCAHRRAERDESASNPHHWGMNSTAQHNKELQACVPLRSELGILI
ncbi:hypothetical protein DNTS_032532 [Danionella cerebrum]|uniref:Uncharacterized protein n=1 Tax=Danionella cerebrum TaxID=2873325 RepID=A0A553R258_9TELE|nr:hypothetical protein DNTS_032532 [Danionella translucida]